MGNRTPLYEQHRAACAKIVDFAGWDMPLHYGSQLQEHQRVREDAGVFDVSHMVVSDVIGARARDFLRYLLANDVDKLTQPGKALYTCLLNEQAGVIDDLIVYRLPDNNYRIISNAATRDKDLSWFQRYAADFAVEIRERSEFVMLAVQGPQALRKTKAVLSAPRAAVIDQLSNFHGIEIDGWFIARTGYTGEDGLEILVPREQAAEFWNKLLESGVAPCGLGARDTLRLEAGLNLYGTDMDETTTPLESNLAWTVAWEPQERNFIGRSALEKQKQQGVKRSLVGLVLLERGVLRGHQKVTVEGNEGKGHGEITSGSFSPALNNGIALARIPAGKYQECLVEIRDKFVKARVVKPPFVRQGKVVINNFLDK